MIRFTATARKRGNSIWVTIPKEIVKREDFRVGQKLICVLIPHKGS